MLASACYGFAACYTRLYASGLKPLVTTTGSQIFASILLIVPGIWAWPETLPSTSAWRDVVILAIGCTGIAYILYFRILSREGVSAALSVTYLVPLFAFIWGWLFLSESVTMTIIIGAITILLGVALTTGVLKLPKGVFAQKANAK
jgi:drug/metabolite transporter (DMT)-like permease